MQTRLPWRPTRGSLTSPSYLVKKRTLGPPLENNPKTPPSSRDEGLRLLHGLSSSWSGCTETDFHFFICLMLLSFHSPFFPFQIFCLIYAHFLLYLQYTSEKCTWPYWCFSISPCASLLCFWKGKSDLFHEGARTYIILVVCLVLSSLACLNKRIF